MTSPHELDVLGIDPGQSGAMVALDCSGRLMWGWMCWTLMRRKASPDGWRVTWSNSGTSKEVPNLGQLVQDIEQCAFELAPFGSTQQLVVEGLYIPSGQKQKVQELLGLAEQVGRILQQLATPRAQAPVMRPLAREWRPRTAGIPGRTTKARAEALAIEKVMAGLVCEAPMHTEGLTKAELGAVCEAACIARDGWSMRRYHPYWTGSDS